MQLQGSRMPKLEVTPGIGEVGWGGMERVLGESVCAGEWADSQYSPGMYNNLLAYNC